MNEADQAAQLVFPGFKFGLDDPGEAQRLVDLGVGGFCLYGGEVREAAEFTSRLQARARLPLLFCADYEDGLAAHCAGGTSLPSNMGLGAAGSEALAYQKGTITALESRAIGVPWVLAPVVDLATLPSNPIVNVRAFSSDPDEAARLARAYLKGLKSERVLSCLKHFPGHGQTRRDSHLEMPLVKASRAVLERRELSPYRALAREADAVMIGHLSVPALEKNAKLPYSLSEDVGKTLRGALGFEGLVSTDALNMRAVAGRFEESEAAALALLGGSDILLVPAKPAELIDALRAALGGKPGLRAAVRASFERLQKARLSTWLSGAQEREKSLDIELVGCRKHREAAERMAESCLAWARRPVGAGKKIHYWELEADSPEEWQGSVFVESLRRGGLEVRPYEGKKPPEDEALVLGCFLSPRAYTGRIQYDAKESARVRKALSLAQRALIVSFGSPFVFESFRADGLCAFSKNEAAQKAAARALSGALEVKGRMPVTF